MGNSLGRIFSWVAATIRTRRRQVKRGENILISGVSATPVNHAAPFRKRSREVKLRQKIGPCYLL
jgi:hypothetical protein